MNHSDLTIPNEAKKKCYDTAIRLLAIREHSSSELSRKLKSKGCNQQYIESVLLELESQKLQSDERYAQSVIRVRQGKGYGPLYIQNYLREKGVHTQIIESMLDFHDPAWQKVLFDTAIKKFGSARPSDFKEKAKRMNFLMRRGFTSEQIRNLFKRHYDNIDEYENQ